MFVGREAVTLSSRKAAALVAYLAVERGAHSRTALAGLLWPELPERRARANLRKELSNLRPVLGPFLEIGRSELSLRADAAIWVDVFAFERLVGAADITTVAQGVPLYEGDFLDGFYVLNAPPFDQWTLAHRARLRDLLLRALQRLVAHHIAVGARREAAAYVRRLLALEPWHEPAHRQLMILLAEDGQRSAALAQYEACRRVLAAELDVEPSAETTRLYAAIRDETLPLLARAGGAGTAPAVRHNLPPQATPFVGRERELRELARMLAQPTVRWITITGPGGIGKTRLSLAAAENEIDRLPALFPAGVYFASLARLESAAGLEPAIARAVGLMLEPAARAGRSPMQQLHDYLRDREMLLVLDNAEHLLGGPAAADAIGRLLQAGPRVKVLLTSREAVGAHAEHFYPLRGFARRRWTSPEQAKQDPRVQLFVAGARRVRPTFALTPEALPAIAEIARHTAGMPLAIELAAAWADTLPLSEIAGELRRGLSLLQSDSADLPARHRSIGAAFAPSWRSLQPAAQSAFAGMSVFRGGFAREAAAAVLDVGPPLLKQLVRRSLLWLGADGRYQMHPLLREFAAEKLAETPDSGAAVRQRHSDFMCGLLVRFDRASRGPDVSTALAALNAEAANLFAGWRAAVSRGDWTLLAEAFAGFAAYCTLGGHDEAARSHARLLADALAGAEDVDSRRLRLRALALWARHFPSGPERDAAFAEVRSELAALEPQENWPGRLRVVRALAEHLYRHDRPRAITMQTAALEVAAREGDADEELALLLELANMHHFAGDSSAAAAAAQRAQALAPASDNLLLRADLMQLTATLGFYQFRLEEAARAAEEGYNILRRLGLRAREVMFLALQGWIAHLSGEFRAARDFFMRKLQLSEELGTWERIAQSHFETALALVHVPDHAAAESHARRAEAFSSYGVPVLSIAFAQCVRAEIAIAQGRSGEAEALLRGAIGALRDAGKSGQPDEVAYDLAWLALALIAQGRVGEGRAAVVEALEIVLQTRSFKLANVLTAAAVLAIAEGAPAAAVEIYAAAHQFVHVRRSPWFETVAGQAVAEAAAELPVDTATRAAERGQNGDLWALARRLYETTLAWDALPS